jgi:GMP synthase-like glutamine amidotransferase
MRIHLLQHDPIDHSRDNITIWSQKKGYELTQTYLYNKGKLPSFDEFDWLIIMGGSQHAWDEKVHPWLTLEKEFISKSLEQEKIILSICFGTQLIAETLGGEVFPNKEQEIGWFDVSLTPEGKKSFLFKNIPKTFVTFHWHSDHFSLPPCCTRLAQSEPTSNQAFVCKDRPLVGLQFHPEITPKMADTFAREYGHKWVKGRFVSGKETVLKQTIKIPDTYWLMASILDNMDQEFKELALIK